MECSYLVVVVLLVQFMSALVETTFSCIYCLAVEDPSLCHTRTKCSTYQLCYAEVKVTERNNSLYFLDCQDAVHCDKLAGSVIIGKREDTGAVTDVTTCKKCCKTDECNREICGTKPDAVNPDNVTKNNTYVRLAVLGQVEVFVNGVWSTLCVNGWDDDAAQVACHMMGYSREGSKAVNKSTAGTGLGVANLDGLTCQGDEDHLLDCALSAGDWSLHACPTLESAGVVCNYTGILDNFLLLADRTFRGGIVRMDLDTFSYALLYAPRLTSSIRPVALTFEPMYQRVYSLLYVNSSDGLNSEIWCQDVQTTGPAYPLMWIQALVNGIAVDSSRNLLFMTDATNRNITRAYTTGTDPEPVVSLDDEPHAVTLDQTNQTVYWSTVGAGASIESADYEGNNRQVLASTMLLQPVALAFDQKTRQLYFCDAGTHRIEVMDSDGKNRKLLFADDSVQFLGFTLTSSHIFFSDQHSGGVHRLERDGSNLSQVGPKTLEVDGIVAYQSSSASSV
ncbi:pro-epidermal growth factor-like [Physella acuta]|uniref:pro-epidermal growth factor-like n=1 Tax=Physella acuta TaxID=109671 RepID=UPI0027DCA58F|nr:pro-epidermal growth factor-like [Physella acuta]